MCVCVCVCVYVCVCVCGRWGGYGGENHINTNVCGGGGGMFRMNMSEQGWGVQKLGIL